MDLSWDYKQLLSEQDTFLRLPEEILIVLREGSNVRYLETISALALDPARATIIFATHEPVLVEICSRWLITADGESLSALAALSRILPLAPHASVYAKALLKQRRNGTLEALASRKGTGLQEIPEGQLHTLLLVLCRLLMFGNEDLAEIVTPVQLQVLLRHNKLYIRYLAIRILCLYLHASDVALGSMIKSYIGELEIAGPWEDKIIDYTFFSLWEDKRLKDIARRLQKNRAAREAYRAGRTALAVQRRITLADLSRTTACIGGVLVPRLDEISLPSSTLVMTETVIKNLHAFADGLNDSRPLLITGPSGAGKTSLIRSVARELGKSSSMVTLHLNEQTDAKLLIGMYTNAKTPGSFSWRPGVLTNAVMEGRWVVIEDLNRASVEIIGTLLPLLERRELVIPNWGECILAAPGFKLIATVRSAPNVHGEDIIPTANMLGIRHWLRVPFQTPSQEELAEIVKTRFPILRAYIPRFMDVYSTLKAHLSSNMSKSAVHPSISRPLGPQDLLRWYARVEKLLLAAGISSDQGPITEAVNDYIFLEAIDCFVGAFPSGHAKSYAVDIVAQGLQVPAERVRYCLGSRKPHFDSNGTLLQFGRTSLCKRKRLHGAKSLSSRIDTSPFATTNHVLRILESVAVTVRQAEPCLLVGETGTGKTTIVQRLAEILDQKLTVVNMSQQSEAGDLLGGYKPVSMRALAVPMKEEFDDLVELTFPSKRNQHYIDTLGKSIAKGRWERALTLWKEALRMIEIRLKHADPQFDTSNPEPHTKKRKLQSPKTQKLKSRWEKFASEVQTFQMHLANGSRGFAFSFVEGNIVKAARNGEWVLLDEINLASPDTLESLADLFSDTNDGGPTILLTDAGDAERVHAHKDFRIFGAMNPATDIGKRDLPISLRSRFTEIFVEAPDKDLDNLIPVVKAYLGTHNHVDSRAAHDVAQLYLEIRKLADENLLVDGANQKPHFSLRTLTRTLTYVLDIAPIYGLRRALFEGFSMSFLTLLKTESELLLHALIDKRILKAQKNSRASLHQTPHLPQDGKQYVQFKHYWIAQGHAPVEQQAHYIITPFIERNLLNLVRAISTRRFPVLLQGPTSSGKTSMIEYLARLSGNKFVRINNHEHTDLQEYLGTYISGPDGRLQYQEGVLIHALREGYWVVLDELNLAPTDVLEALNRLLDDNRELLIPETQQVVRPHENFMLFATQNPPRMYGGRKILSRAFRNRFLELHFDDIPDDELETILRERSQIAPSFCTRIVAVYKKLSILRQSERLFEQKNSFATLRDLFRWALRDADDREQLAVNGFLLLAERVRNTEERNAVKRVIEEVMKVQIDETQIYSMYKMEQSLGMSISSHREIVWTKSMRRLYVLVTEALRNNEPVLLVGKTGSGKTTICQIIAKIINTKLHIVNAHQNMETGDLIGAQRPIRNRTLAEAQLSQELIAVLKSCNSLDNESEYDISTLQSAYETLQHEKLAILSDETRARIEQAKIRANALFEWADGSLVHAMENGQHFLLDEISLADDSVLERLNSVLEPSRTLFLAEKCSSDALVKAISGFQFLATMNPGGDYGKRELSPALRNRFTEIWVPHASEKGEMLEIAQAKLTAQLFDFSQPMVDFAAWYAATYNAAEPHISIRDLLSWIDFADTFHVSDPYSALVHGAATVYIDGLGANPTSKISIAETAVPQERQACLLELDGLFGHSLSSSYSEALQLSVTRDEFAIGPFSLPKSSTVKPDPKYSLQAPTTMANSMKIMRALKLRKPVLLEGSPGVGKTTLVAALAHSIGMPLTRINLSDQTDLMDLFGSDVPIEGEEAGHFGWRDAPFLRAMRKGEWVLLDEMNLASQSVLEGLNACFDHRGQVYISELDQTFERHPDFVVFAAQNPHHQGGGRKGLPASFVNRFTVVYAETFTPEDLLVISREIFPEFPIHESQKIIQCVTALNQFLQQNRRVGAHGGPWEINLRDILRWHHLLTDHNGLMPTISPTDCQPLLFLQRFRTSDDVAAVSKLLQQYLPHDDESQTYFHGKSDTTIEIGLGVLARDRISQAASSRNLRTAHCNLPIAESIMICIQNIWPCLLVGPSGSGKTDLILQLASSVGAEVVNLSLNPDMDTMDLVGGYEQQDPKRGVTGFVKRLRDYTQRAINEQMVSNVDLSKGLFEVEEKLRGTTVDLSEVVQLIRDVAMEYPSSKYTNFLCEYERITHHAPIDNRARFEWVDGILVKTLKQGRWLVLDNANLCNPAVLDRLNSLLEPKGFLSINEHRNPDGSAQIVKPHPNFRLFITMDPCHGELSRAMRNRSIELFMPAQSRSPALNVLGSGFESTVSRFDIFQAIDWNNLDEFRFKELLAICFDHLAFSDLRLLLRWQTQIIRGLNNFTPSKHAWFSSVAEIYEQMSGFEGSILSGIRTAYGKVGQALAIAPDIISMQTIHPCNNPVLLSRKARNACSSSLYEYGQAFELLANIYRFGQRLALVSEGIQSKSTPQMSRLERSLASTSSRNVKNDSTQPLASFLQSMESILRDLVDGRPGDGRTEQDFLLFADKILSYLLDVLDLSHSPNFDEGTFQALQTIGRGMTSRASTDEVLGSLTARLAFEFGSKLDNFNVSWQLHSGLGMELLWTAFRPVSARNLDQLELSNQTKDLANRFDALKWGSGTSVHELCSLQRSIARIHNAIEFASPLDSRSLEDVQKTLEGLGGRFDVVDSTVSPYLESQFEALCQYKACAGDLESLESHSELGLLAGRSTARLMRFGTSPNAWETLSQMQQATAIGHLDMELATVRNILPISMLHELEVMSEVQLRRLGLLCVEIGSVSKIVADSSATISGDPLHNLNRLLLRLQDNFRTVLDLEASFPNFEKAKGALDQLLSPIRETLHDQTSVDERSQHLRRSLERAFDRQQPDMPIAIGEQHEDTAHTSADFIQFFTGCLLLYVPDRPCDPASKPMIERNRHNKRRSELENKLQALKDFEVVFSGQQTSLRSQLVEKRLAELGAEPEVPIIFRPQISELGQLQAEFNNVLKSIILRSPTPSTQQSVFRHDLAKGKEVELLRMNIAQVVSRLARGFQAYEDITKPLISFLQGLDIGLALSLLSGSQHNPRDQSMQYMCEMTPFLGASPQGLARITVSELDLYRSPNFDARLHFLKCTGMARSVSENLGEPLVQKIFQTFRSFYEEWKEQLGRDQQNNLARSSLYRYRGGEEEGNEADEQNFYSLFSEDNRRNEQHIASKGPRYDARDQAQRLARLQRELFQCSKTATEQLLDLLQGASQAIAGLWENTSKISICQMPAENLLSALVLSLDRHKERLLGQAEVGKLYNFYSDVNLSEAQKMIALVYKTQARFQDLQETWPEHATLADVLRTSSELLALRHTEPIAKILTKAEQLHGYIHEWQVVASKQYTAATLYEQLTDLLVSWRRLELSTWARLLDMEDQKCNEDAESWWFIAYEVIVAAPLSMVDAGEGLQVHVKQLFSTLAEFIGNTSIGQYSYRLGMIDCFRSHLEILAKDVPLMGVVHDAIFNFRSYYGRFENHIQENLRKGRQKLEKDMKEILLLASWKDTNINALRDSAKRSHHKLFKVIRKYRNLLAQSAETFIAHGVFSQFDVSAPSKRKYNTHEVTIVDPRAIQTCKSRLGSWESKPERYINPSSTARRMLEMSQLPPTAIDCESYLDSFGTDLIDSIVTLQKETPIKATRENGEAIKHLKARKRKLYVETLKALRQMGFRSNLSVDALAKQSSLSAVLTNTPALATQSDHRLASAEFHLHKVLHIISEINERSRNHSKDLSHGEVARSLGYLESMVSVILKQRNVLAITSADLRELDKTTEIMHELWAPDLYALKKSGLGPQNAAKGVQYALRWLPGIIEAGSVIIEKHGRMGEIDHSTTLAGLKTWKDKMAMANIAFDQLPTLPSNLSSSRHEKLHHDAVELLKNFMTNLGKLIENNSGLAFVLKQIAQWTSADVAYDILQMNGEHPTSFVDLDTSVSTALDSILVAIQRMQEISSTIPSSGEDTTWLLRANSSLAASLKNLHPREVNDLLREAMSQIQYLSSVNDSDVSFAGALFAMALPIVEQFRSVLQVSFNRYAELHRAFCRLSDHLAHSFSQVVQEGFCSPAEDSAAEAGRTEKLEGGTGLGEGEGAEDISKDIQDDEDLSDLAHGMEKKKENEEIEDQENAVEMDHDELEGEMGDISDTGENDGSASEGEENDVDEETGSIDDIDPSAVDEKFWDGTAEKTDKKKEGAMAKGKAEKDDQVAGDATEQQESTQAQEGEEEECDDEASQNGVEEAEEVARKETEKIDPQVQEGRNLDLPEEMDLDNVAGTDAESASGDSDLEGISDLEQGDVEDKEADGLSEGSHEDEFKGGEGIEVDDQNQPEDKAKDDLDVDKAEDAGSPVDTEPDNEEPEHNLGFLQDGTDNQNVDLGSSVPSHATGLGQDIDKNEARDQMEENKAQGKDGAQGTATSTDEPPEAAAEDGQLGGLDRTGGGQIEDDNQNKSRDSQAFKKLGDALEKWHRQNSQIQDAPEKEANASPQNDVDMTDQDFEHLHDEEAKADTQALGAASNDQARALDKKAMDSEMQDEPHAFPRDETDEEGANEHDKVFNEEADKQQEQSNRGFFAASRNDCSQPTDQPGTVTVEKEEDIDDLDNDLSTTHLQPAPEGSPRSAEEARRLWSHYESLTRDLSLSLTEQLRLILAPTLATRMRGDFRTGKRLNIKRIIPYIASQYKRDKIWMRRSIPSKRNYQIMLAVDDSKSMGESGSGQLAFETLALVSKSFTMLEVGEICVVGFGKEVRVVHEFDKAFSSEAGAQVFQQFGFQQTKTNVRKLVADSITLFREARRRKFNAGTEPWQLELIISDGVCEDHDTIRRLVRQAQEERIMIVFVIVDALLKGESVMEMSQAVYEPDATGETKLKIKRYLDGFPFAYYLVVGNVRELPGVLAQVLKQWFAEIVESG